MTCRPKKEEISFMSLILLTIHLSLCRREAAFICNLEQHWYTLRRFGPSTQRWYDLNSLHPRPQHMSATYLGMTLSQLEAEGYSIFVVRPLAKDGGKASALTAEEDRVTPPAATEKVPSLPPKSADPVATSTTALPATATGFLSERQEMERIRRQRIEERERASQQSASSSSPATETTTTATALNTSTTHKRTRVEPTDGGTGKETRRPSTSVLVTTPSFLPRCEVDDMAATMPLQEQSKDHTSSFGGAGHRLGGSEPTAEVDSFAGASTRGQDDDNDDEDDLEAQMMQQAIAMSLQGAQK